MNTVGCIAIVCLVVMLGRVVEPVCGMLALFRPARMRRTWRLERSSPGSMTEIARRVKAMWNRWLRLYGPWWMVWAPECTCWYCRIARAQTFMGIGSWYTVFRIGVGVRAYDKAVNQLERERWLVSMTRTLR